MKLYQTVLIALITIIFTSCSTGYTLTNGPADYRLKMVQLDKLSIGLHVADADKNTPDNISAFLMINHAQSKSGLKISNLAVTLQNTQSGDKYLAADTVAMRYSADTVIQRREEVLSNHDLLNGKIIRIADRTTYTLSYHFAAPATKQQSKDITGQVEFNQTDTSGNTVRVTKSFNFQRNKYLNVSGN
ncbi:MAG: hypothetical protein V4577_01875 [Bacteroidota bacterium]